MNRNDQEIFTIGSEDAVVFFGTKALDTLHDCKDYYFEPNLLLKTFTDAIAFHYSSDKYPKKYLKNYFFKTICQWFCKIWEKRIVVLGLKREPNFDYDLESVYWDSLSEKVLLPIQSKIKDNGEVSTSICCVENGMTAVNKNWSLIFDYYKDYLSYKVFKSPSVSLDYNEYMTELRCVHEYIFDKNKKRNSVCLDMKSSGGLIRAITDPFGYTNTTPLYMDPGYKMCGMSKIRHNAVSNFALFDKRLYVDISLPKKYDTDQKTVYFGNIQYKKTNDTSTFSLNNGTKDYIYFNKITSGKEMSNTLSVYSKLSSFQNTNNGIEMIEKNINSVIKDIELSILEFHYPKIIERRYLENLRSLTIYELLEFSIQMYGQENIEAMQWCMELMKEIYEYEKEYRFFSNKPIKKYTCSNTSIYSLVYKSIQTYCKTMKNKMVENLHCNNNLQTLFLFYYNYFIKTDNVRSDKEYKMIYESLSPYFQYLSIVYSIPVSYFNNNLHIAIYYLIQYAKTNRLLNKDFKLEVQQAYKTRHCKYNPYSENWHIFSDAYKNMIGKFMGDFGQILWCFHNGYVFATEDANTAAMSLLFHKYSTNKEYITVYGKGDGGSVYLVSCGNENGYSLVNTDVNKSK